MTVNGKYIWMDGTFVQWDKARIHPMSNSIQYGIGIFEGLRSFSGKEGNFIFRLQDHTDRLFQSAHILGMKIPFTKKQLNEAQIETVKKNKILQAYIRPYVYFGEENHGFHSVNLKVHAMIAVFEMKSELDPEKPIKLHSSSFIHAQANSQMCRAKSSGNYLSGWQAFNEAKAVGYDDALIFDQQGHVTETSGANVFIVNKGVLYTPTETNILPGITRNTVFSIAKDLNLELVVKTITKDEVYIADEVFITGTATEIQSVSFLDTKKIGSETTGPITRKIQKAYKDIVSGSNSKYINWLTPI